MMLWKEPDKEAIYERELLRNYLSDQWISMENQNIMLDNLDKYDQWWLNINNNFIANTMASTFSKVTTAVMDWKDAIVQDFFDFSNNKSIVYNDINVATSNSSKNIELKERFAELYNSELPYAAVWDIDTEALRAKIIETHISLDDSINILEKTIKTSKKVCNSQNSKFPCN